MELNTQPQKRIINKKAIIFLTSCLVLLTGVFVLITTTILPNYHYEQAMKYMEAADYTQAYDHFIKCRNFKDTNQILKKFSVCGTQTTVTVKKLMKQNINM